MIWCSGVCWLHHCMANLQIVGSNHVQAGVCGFYFPLADARWPYVPGVTSDMAKQLDSSQPN